MPELAEAGYTSIWLPPPTKGSGGLSVGYDMWDPFDFGQKDQRNTVRTRYGTEAELIQMMEVAHRFGIRVYFDNIMNHRAFDVPGYNEDTPIDTYPGMVPEDFHLRKTEDGFYRKWDNTRDWNSAWQVQNLGLADLIDIAHETPNANHGTSEGSTHPKLSFIRDLARPEQYDKDKDGNTAYFGVLIDQSRAELTATNTNAPTSAQIKAKAQEYINARKASFTEDVGGYLIRAARWKIDRTKADGLRLDAVKHVPDYFFGKQSGADKDTSNDGYLGQVQWQFDRTRGFGADNSLLSGYNSDVNKRDSVFDEKRPRNDAMLFGEHLGQPPGYGGYWDAGMRLVDNDLRSKLNGVLGIPGAQLGGLDQPGWAGANWGDTSVGLGIAHANSHDSEYAAQKEWQHAFYMTREGIGLIYSDGFNKAETLGESGGAFPRHANTQYLGQFGDPRIPNILKIHNDYARGLQKGLWAGSDLLVFERRDNRNSDGSRTVNGQATNEVTMVMMMNDNTATGVRDDQRRWNSSFPSGAYLYQYAVGPNMSGFYKYANEINNELVPAGGYYVFSYRTPELSTLWPSAAITLYQNGSEVPRITVTRKDGRDGDASFNPEGLTNRGYPAGTTPLPYTYQTSVPVVKGGSPLTIMARADGSAENILVKLDGGVDLNGTGLGADPAKRDNPPGLRTDVFLGYEQPSFLDRQHPEKFAAAIATNCQIGSAGAETYIKTVGGTATVNNGPTGANSTYNTENGNVVSFAYHDPEATVGGPVGTAGVGDKQLNESGSNFVIWVKTNSGLLDGFKAVVYYTTDGSFPEGAGGIGRGTTRVAAIDWKHDQGSPDAGSWWGSVSIPQPAAGAKFTYKIGVYRTQVVRDQNGNITATTPSWFPSDLTSVEYKKKMMTTFRVADFNPATVQHFPHNDYARTPTLGQPYSNWPFAMRTGLAEGFHVLRARAFLKRDNQAPLYQTFTQTFYYDAQTPQGLIAFPQNNNDQIGGSSYELVVRTDSTVEEVWYHIDDADAQNNDAATKQLNGNGAGFEPFDDANQNGVRDAAEEFTDINGNGTYDTSVPDGWAKATEVAPPAGVTQKEWRFRYNNIPATGTGTVNVRLLEASSSRNLTLPAAQANVTELTRTLQTRGPDERVMVAWPQSDSNRIDDNYTMKVYFTKVLADGTTIESLKNRFTFSIASQSSGSPDGAVIQSRNNFTINYNVNDQFHELAIPLPNMYNGIADFLHTLKVVYTFPSDYSEPAKRGLKLEAVRFVTANPSTKPFIRITRPTELGSDGKPTEIILPDNPGADSLNYVVQVETSVGVTDPPILTGITTTGTPTVSESTNAKIWTYSWNITAASNYTITAETTLNGQTATTSRGARVILRQIVESDGITDNDDDNDGLIDIDETNQKDLPTGNAETWGNGAVHLNKATGRSLPTSPDSDGDRLPDGLEVGWRGAISPPTDIAADTNGDGMPNFRGDLDPPLYAVVENYPNVPGVGSQSQGDDRTRQAWGSVTDPANADSDGDGILDGVEDENVNGWTDGDGKSLPLASGIAQYPTVRPNAGDWPNNIIDSFETWAETSPTKADSDDDGLQDGYGEDQNGNGFIDGDTDKNRVYNAGEAWTETNPLNKDTDGDGLPDGWETQFGLDALDNGTDNFRTAAPNDGNPNNGATGDPDNDGVNNLDEFTGGTHPNQQNNPGGGGPGEGTIRIGQFADWNHNDLLVLDEYNEGGSQAADVYRSYNDTDNSRDILSFSFRDGGSSSNGGDGRVYLRIDFLDLAPNAWQGEVDAYVAIDTGNPAVGERAMPNEVDIASDMGWEVVVAAYGQDFGTVFVDKQRTNNTSNKFQNPNAAFGVETRGFGAPGLNRAAWSSTFDALEISIDRQNLIDAGWQGDPNTLNFQVFTTKPNTQNGVLGIGVGSGDLGGRNDIRDSIYDDWVASDYWKDQDNIKLNEKLSAWFSRSGSNDRNKYSKVMLLAHGNQAIQPASVTQALVRSGTPAVGYSRLLQTHEAYNAPLTLHLTPTLASALQWAVNPSPGAWPNNDGPSFNAKLRSLISAGRVALLGSTFSDHVPKYFPQDFNNENKALGENFLDGIYGSNTASRSVFWPPERILDTASLDAISGMGYSYTFADQMKHFVKWFGRTSALGESGYRINQVNGLKIFPIHDEASTYLEQTRDEGSTLPVRQLLSRRSRSNVQDQVVVLWKDMGDFSSDAKATSYDTNVRWLSSRPWIRVVTAQQIAGGQVQYPRLDNGQLEGNWGTITPDTAEPLAQTAKDWLDWASGGNYDNWYNGSTNEQGLRNRTFGTANTFGRVGDTGNSQSAWLAASGIPSTIANSTSKNPVRTLAQATLHAAMFQTAFHNTPAGDLSKFSTGDYINPDNGTGQTLADFARFSQSQARFAKVYERVQQWNSDATSATLGTEPVDVDLDGQDEYLLFNSRVFAVFEGKGGRMTAAWIRHHSTKQVWQVAGNFAAYSNTDTEDEGASNFVGTTTTLSAYRTSGFKDWWTVTGTSGSSASVNATYGVTYAPPGVTGWKFTQGSISKTITLSNAWTGNFQAAYLLNGPTELYVRFGLSPNLMDLMINGHANLSELDSTSSRINLLNQAPEDSPVRAFVATSANSSINQNVTDVGTTGFTTVNLRNQAQTQQVEVRITGTTTVTLGFDQGIDFTEPMDFDSDLDGIPDAWERTYNNGDIVSMTQNTDGDSDGLLDIEEYVMGSNPNDASSGPMQPQTSKTEEGFQVSFPTIAGRVYTVKFRDNLGFAAEPLTTEKLKEGQTNPIYGDGTTKSVTDITAGAVSRRFYEVEVSLPPPSP